MLLEYGKHKVEVTSYNEAVQFLMSKDYSLPKTKLEFKKQIARRIKIALNKELSFLSLFSDKIFLEELCDTGILKIY